MKSIIISGAASGLGLTFAKYCLENGYRVFGTYRNRAPNSELCARYPKRFIPMYLDLAKEKTIVDAVAIVEHQLRGEVLYALVNNAAYVDGKPLMLCTAEDFSSHFQINTIGTFLMMKHFMPLLNHPTSKGRIININSMAGQLPLPFQGAYGVSKTGLSFLSNVIRLEQFPEEQIPIVDIWLGMVQTGLHQQSIANAASISETKYGKRGVKMIQTVQQNISKALSPEQVASKLFKILQKRNPKHRYIISKGKWKIRLLLLFKNKGIIYRLIRRNYFGKEGVA